MAGNRRHADGDIYRSLDIPLDRYAHASVQVRALETGVFTMDSIVYVNIFETKGLEYVLLLCFWVLFIYLVRYLAAPMKRSGD
jgi:hypothetical protein